ncbi:amidohydrolase family protein [Yinghuangia sp. YIM S09857]|uniref:amidohydrolase family protein n=1 Tax=Yinghuangia sp. YIM S09857 TaxID=3436929 RepID=UPI003F533ED1
MPSPQKPEPDASARSRIPLLIDVDAHVVEPPDVWSSRLPQRYRDVGPRVLHLPGGQPKLVGGGYVEEPGTEGPDVAWWFYEEHRYSVKRLIAAAGYPADEITMDGVTYDEMRPGCWQPAARVADMDLNGVEAQLCYPNYPRFCGQIFLWGKDRELALLCVKAYNDWMVEEWCGAGSGRLIPLCIVPLWDAELAAAEVRRNAARGVRAVAFSELPSYLGLPSIHSGYWDPFFAACAETGTVLCMHIGSGTKTPQASPDSPDAVAATIIFGNSVASMADMLFSGVPHRFPELKLLYAEAQIGWIPYLLERIDDVWETHRGWSNAQAACPEPPSTYYRRQMYSCFFKDSVGTEMLHRIGVDNVMFETDYPHQDGTWPHSVKAAEEQFGHLDAESIHKIARGNAIRVFGLPLT